MRRHLWNSIKVSIEWRLIAFVITNIFFWITTGEFWKAAGLALILQIILFVAYMFWHLWRHEMEMPLFPSTGFKRLRK